MLSGLGPASHGVESYDEGIGPSTELLPQALRRLGYRSAGVVSVVPFLTRRHGFATGWDFFDDTSAFPSTRDDDRADVGLFRSSSIVTRRGLELLEQIESGPFFLFLHYFDPHDRYQPPPPFDTIFDDESNSPHIDLPPSLEPSRLEAEGRARRYDGEIRSVDFWIGRFLDELDRRGLSDNTAILVTSDHGEEFLEHAAWTHHKNLFDTVLHVPLLLRLPKNERAGQRIDTNVSLIDIPATLLRLAGASEHRWHDGVNLLSDLKDAPRFAHSECGPRSRQFEAAVVDGTYKLVVPLGADGWSDPERPPLLYMPLVDRSERVDLAAQRPDVVARLLGLLESHLRQGERSRRKSPPTQVGQGSADELRDLRSLGYL